MPNSTSNTLIKPSEGIEIKLTDGFSGKPDIYRGEDDPQDNNNYIVTDQHKIEVRPEKIIHQNTKDKIRSLKDKNIAIKEIYLTLEECIQKDKGRKNYHIMFITNPDYHFHQILFDAEFAVKQNLILPSQRKEEAHRKYGYCQHMLQEGKYKITITYKNDTTNPLEIKLKILTEAQALTGHF